MTRVALVGCGRAKLEGTHPARELYTGPLFRAALAHAEATANHVFVVSARHCLVRLDEPVASYDATLPADPAVRGLWAGRVVAQLLHALPPGVPRFQVAVYAGAPYADPIADVAPFCTERLVIERPLRGLTQGRRLAWFKAHRNDTRR